jgi:hypothetical protein
MIDEAGRRQLSCRRVVMPGVINLKFIAAPLTGNQLKELIQIPPRRNSRPEGSGLLQGRFGAEADRVS